MEYSTLKLDVEILCGILTIPHNIIMDLDNVMLFQSLWPRSITLHHTTIHHQFLDKGHKDLSPSSLCKWWDPYTTYF